MYVLIDRFPNMASLNSDRGRSRWQSEDVKLSSLREYTAIHLLMEQIPWETNWKLAKALLYKEGFKRDTHNVVEWQKSISWELCFWQGAKRKMEIIQAEMHPGQWGQATVLASQCWGPTHRRQAHWQLWELLRKIENLEKPTFHSREVHHCWLAPRMNKERSAEMTTMFPCTRIQAEQISWPAHFMPQLGTKSRLASTWESFDIRIQRQPGAWSKVQNGSSNHCCCLLKGCPRICLGFWQNFHNLRVVPSSPSLENIPTPPNPCHNLALDLWQPI